MGEKMTTLNVYSKEQIDTKLHTLTKTGTTPELFSDTSYVSIRSPASGMEIYHIEFLDATLDKVFNCTFSIGTTPTTGYTVVYYDGHHAVHMTAAGGNVYRLEVYDVVNSQAVTLNISDLYGARIICA